MGLGDYHRCRQRMSRGLHGVPCPAGLWSSASAHAAYAVPGSPWSAGSGAQEQAHLTNPVLEHLRGQLERAFQRAVARGRARRAREAVEAAAAAAAAAREERNRMRMECALARLRAELVSIIQKVPSGEPLDIACLECGEGNANEMHAPGIDAINNSCLELRFQNHQLASTLLDLNMKMQQLKKQHELDGASKSGSPEDNAISP